MKNQKIKINGLILASTFAVGVASTNATAMSAKLSGSIKDSKNSSKNDSKTANSQAIKKKTLPEV